MTAAQNKVGDGEIGRIPVDSIYSPVLKVTFSVNATRVEQRTDFDSLTLDAKPRKPSHRVTPLLLQAAPWSSSSAWHVS